MHCLVIEWADGTVDVNGPYADQPTAEKAAALLAEKICTMEDEADGFSDSKVFQMSDDGFFRVGSVDYEDGNDVDEGIDVYVRGMGEPVKTVD